MTTETYSLTVLEAGSLKSRGLWVMLPLKPLEEDLSLPFPASGSPSRSLVCSCNTSVSAPVVIWHSPCGLFPNIPHVRTPVILDQGSPYWPHLNLFTSSESYCQIRSHFQIPGLRISTYLLGGTQSAYNMLQEAEVNGDKEGRKAYHAIYGIKLVVSIPLSIF